MVRRSSTNRIYAHPWRAFVLVSLAFVHPPGMIGCGAPAQVPRTSEDAVFLDLISRGADLARMGDDIRAEHYFVAALEIGAPVDEVLPQLLKACVRSQRYSTALQYAEEYVPGARHAESLQLLVASLYLATAEVAKAQALLERLVTAGTNARAHLLLGDLYAQELRDYARADEQYGAYLALAPRGPRAEQLRLQLFHPVASGPAGPPAAPAETVVTP